MLSEISTATSIKWDTPYRILASLCALLYVGDGMQSPLVGAQSVLQWLGTDNVAGTVGEADRWLVNHASIPGIETLFCGLIFLAVLTTPHVQVPTRSAGTFWILVALSTYSNLELGWIIAVAAGGAIARAIRAHAGGGSAGDTLALVLINVVVAALFAPGVLLLWMFSKSDE